MARYSPPLHPHMHDHAAGHTHRHTHTYTHTYGHVNVTAVSTASTRVSVAPVDSEPLRRHSDSDEGDERATERRVVGVLGAERHHEGDAEARGESEQDEEVEDNHGVPPRHDDGEQRRTPAGHGPHDLHVQHKGGGKQSACRETDRRRQGSRAGLHTLTARMVPTMTAYTTMSISIRRSSTRRQMSRNSVVLFKACLNCTRNSSTPQRDDDRPRQRAHDTSYLAVSDDDKRVDAHDDDEEDEDENLHEVPGVREVSSEAHTAPVLAHDDRGLQGNEAADHRLHEMKPNRRSVRVASPRPLAKMTLLHLKRDGRLEARGISPNGADVNRGVDGASHGKHNDQPHNRNNVQVRV